MLCKATGGGSDSVLAHSGATVLGNTERLLHLLVTCVSTCDSTVPMSNKMYDRKEI